MQFVLEEALFEDPHHALDLLALLWLAVDRDHQVLVDSLWQPGDGGPVQRWADAHGPSVQRTMDVLLGEPASSVADRRSTTVFVSTAGRRDWGWPKLHLPLHEACRFAATPLSVLVESWKTEREFLLALATELRRREALERAMRCSNLVFHNGGGVESMTHYVGQLDESAAARTFVMSDSDDRGLGPSEPVKRLEAACKDKRGHGLLYHRLRRRTIENYLPTRVLAQWKAYHVSQVAVVDAFCNELTPEQRRCFNMKKGFGRHESPERSPLFEKLDAQTIGRLGHGFGSRLMSQVLFEHEIPIREDDLRREGFIEELEQLLDAILDRL